MSRSSIIRLFHTVNTLYNIITIWNVPLRLKEKPKTIVFGLWSSHHLQTRTAKLSRYNCLPDKFAKYTSLVTSQTCIQNVCILAGSPFYFAQQKHLLSKSHMTNHGLLDKRTPSCRGGGGGFGLRNSRQLYAFATFYMSVISVAESNGDRSICQSSIMVHLATGNWQGQISRSLAKYNHSVYIIYFQIVKMLSYSNWKWIQKLSRQNPLTQEKAFRIRIKSTCVRKLW